MEEKQTKSNKVKHMHEQTQQNMLNPAHLSFLQFSHFKANTTATFWKVAGSQKR